MMTSFQIILFFLTNKNCLLSLNLIRLELQIVSLGVPYKTYDSLVVWCLHCTNSVGYHTLTLIKNNKVY